MSLFSNWSVGRRIGLAAAAVFVISVLSLTANYAYRESRDGAHSVLQSAVTVTDLFANQVSGALRWKKTEILDQQSSDLAAADGSTLTTLVIYDNEGKPVSRFQSPNFAPVQLETRYGPQSIRPDGGGRFMELTAEHAIVVLSVNKGESVLGTVATAWSLEGVKAKAREGLLQGLLIGAVTALLGLAALIFALRRFVMAPLRRIIHLSSEVAQGDGDLTRRIQHSRNDEFGELAKWQNLFIERVQEAVQAVGDTSNRLVESSERTSQSAAETDHVLSRQAIEIEQIATAINEMSATVADVASNAARAADSAQVATEVSKQGVDIVGQANKLIADLANNIDHAEQVIAAVADQSQEIGGILEVIRGVSEQTNLLALNAAIEAARAGDQGRGFAVVAEEVRTLASRTHHSTEEIQNMIERLQAGTGDAVDAMRISHERATASVEETRRVNEALDTITQAVANINTMNSQIAAAAEEQSTVAEEINRSIHSVKTAAETTLSQASESATSGREVASAAVELCDRLGRFKT